MEHDSIQESPSLDNGARGKNSKVHLVLSTSINMGILAFFSTTFIYPNQILGPSDAGTAWILIFIMIGLNAAFIFNAFFKRTHGHLIILIGNIAGTIAFIMLVDQFLQYTSDNHEAWIMQMAYFVRDNGFTLGLFFGFSCFSTASTLAYMIALVPAMKSQVNLQRYRFGAVIISVLLLFAILQFLFRDVGATWLLFLSFGLLLVVTASCILPALQLVREGGFITELAPGKTKFYFKTKQFFPADIPDPISDFHARIEAGGSERIAFWWFFMLVLLADGAIIYYMIHSFPTSTPMYMVYAGLVLLVWFLFATYSFSRRRSDNLLERHGIRRWKVSGLAYVDGFRVLMLVVACAGIVYIFPYPVYIPDVLCKVAFFGAIGSLLATVVIKNRLASHAMYIIMLAIIIFNYIVVFLDVMQNAYNYYGIQDLFFPFQYLFGWEHVGTSGLAIGYLITNEFVHFTTRHNDGGDSSQRGIVLTLFSIILPAGAIYAGYGLIGGYIPGGQIDSSGPPDLTLQGNWTLASIFIVLILVALGAIVLYLVKIGYLSLAKQLARRNVSLEPRITGQAIPRRNVVQLGKRLLRPSQALGIMILATVALSFIGGFSIGTTFRTEQARPLVYYDPNKFALWLANSSERISPTTTISLDPANMITTFTIDAAANEYQAFQLVWTPLGKSMNGLNFVFTRFNNTELSSQFIPATSFEVREVQYIIGGSFPDVLVPFTSIDLLDSNLHSFWVSVRVPYGTKAGSYAGNMSLRYDYNAGNNLGGSTIRIPFTVNVFNFTVPQMRHLRIQMGGRSYSNSTVQDFFAHRINDYGIDIPSTWNGTNYTYDWATWDANIQWKLANHANSFILSGGPGWTLSDGRTPFVNDSTRMNMLVNWLKGVQQHLVAKNWTRYGYLYYIDEFQMFIPAQYHGNRTAYFNDLRTQLQAMKTAAPKIKIMTTSPPTAELKDLKDYIDIYCPIATDYNQTEWNGELANGKEFWEYYCVGPGTPWPNSHLYNRLFETRVLIWQCFHYGIQGFLYWSSDAEYHGNYGFAYNSFGDGWFIHYDAAGNPYDSPRWENYLLGEQDYEYCWLANRTIAWLRVNSTAYTNTQLDQYKATLDSLVASVASDREIHTDHPTAIINARLAIASMLTEFSAHAPITILGEQDWKPVS
ncbi:MAG TPA: glycoside hydrolase domain-containing protein [Candidatus Lokiarchaeia archaeon]|nr:glycoside hydrolase domain-containing protein [Candidatus Lokiarchaeia archaeon]